MTLTLRTPNWRPAFQELLRFTEARLFSGKPSLHFLGCVIGGLFRVYEYDFDQNPNLSGPEFSLAPSTFVSRSTPCRTTSPKSSSRRLRLKRAWMIWPSRS